MKSKMIPNTTDEMLETSPVVDGTDDPALGWSHADAVGIVLSVLCAVHCAATPLLIAALPSLGLTWFEEPWVHQVFFVGCLLLAGNAVRNGYRRHGRRSVPAIAVGGLGLLAASAFVWPAPCCAADVVTNATTAGEHAEGHVCAHCVAAARDGDSTTAVDTRLDAASESPAAASFFAVPADQINDLWLRLMTPIGGVLLIVAHVLNIRALHGCRCGCCPTEAGEVEAVEKAEWTAVD